MENTENQEKEVQQPQVKFDPSLDKFTNIKSTDDLLKAIEVINNAIPLKVRYIRVTGTQQKPVETVVEHSIWTDKELEFLKSKLIHLVNYVQ